MKKILVLTAVLLFVVGGQTARAADAPSVSAQAAAVYHVGTGRLIYEKNAHDSMLIASTTKIMTALVVLERCGLQETVTITEKMATVEGSSMYLQQGNLYTVEELLYGLMLASGNDAATALAVHTAGDTASFAMLMNEKAYQLGLSETHFENPHGLDSATHYSTAADMARLMAVAMEHSTFARIVGTRVMTIQGLTYVNHNKLLWQCEGVIGGKTGYTMAAGRTLVTCCERDGERLICVTLRAADDWNDHGKLYDWAYSAYGRRMLLEQNTRYLLPLVSSEEMNLAVEPLTDVTVFAALEDELSFSVQLPPFVYGPVYVGDRIGRITVYLNQKEVGEVPLVSMEQYEPLPTHQKPHWQVRLRTLLKRE